ncbi:MAG: hypothetical protein QUS09_00770 [Methanotrichaceae archaeon]|nr:hypothetical protein [Methanotrichaceae archaeon]
MGIPIEYVFNLVDPAPWAFMMDQSGLVAPDDRLRKSIVVGVAHASDLELDASFR